jgi:hypothetical protein
MQPMPLQITTVKSPPSPGAQIVIGEAERGVGRAGNIRAVLAPLI